MSKITHVRIKNTDMIREMSSQAVLSTNRSDLVKYQLARKLKLEEKKRVDDRFTKLEQEIECLKQLIKEATHGNKSN